MKKIPISLGICAYNEEENIGKILDAILKQKKPQDFVIDEILIVSSGSTDETNEIVITKQKKDHRIKLFVQKERKGKAAAVNLFLRKAKNDYLVLESADTLPTKDAFANLLPTLKAPGIGMTQPRIIPINDPRTLMGFATHLWWKLLDKINLQFPERIRCGEVIAFKKIFKKIPPTSIVDEAAIEPLIYLQGYKIKYCPEAVFFNKGPETIRDFLRQRRRHYAGHTETCYRYGYTVITYNHLRLLGTFLANIDRSNWRFFVYTPIIILLELLARITGWVDFHLELRSHTAWKIAKSTKKLKSK